MFRMYGGIVLIIEREGMTKLFVKGLDNVTELSREKERDDELEVAGPAAGLIIGATSAHHIHVQLRDDRVARHLRVVVEVLLAEEAYLFARMPN